MAGKNVKPTSDEPRGVYVKWHDAYAPDFGWVTWDDDMSKDARAKAVVETFGYLLEENTEGIIVALCYGRGVGNVFAPMFIPIGCILEQKDIALKP